MHRRLLLKNSTALAALGMGAALPAAASASLPTALGASAAGVAKDIIKPRRLEPGMTLGLIAPASPPDEKESIRFAGDVIRSLGYSVKEGENLYAKTQYLAGTDQQRADDVNAMFADPGVDAIFCVTGGYGTTRILPLLDYDTIAANPKALIGYSDITGILNAIYAKTGLIGFHGPVAQRNFGDYALAEFQKVLVNPSAPVPLAAPPPFETRPGQVERYNRITHISGGKGSGRLVGGNLTLMASMTGSPYFPSTDGNILFLEDIDEAPYRVDRMLTELWLAGHLDNLAGVVLGRFTKADANGNSFTLEEVFEDRFGNAPYPVIRGLMIGHMKDLSTIPIGARAELDGDAGTLTLLETAVR